MQLLANDGAPHYYSGDSMEDCYKAFEKEHGYTPKINWCELRRCGKIIRDSKGIHIPNQEYSPEKISTQ